MPRFEHLGDAIINAEGQSITLKFIGSDKKVYECDLAPACVPIVLMQLMGLLGKLLPTLPQELGATLQPIVIRSAQGAMDQNGRVALMLTAENGVEFPLQLESANLAELSAQFAELGTLADPSQRH